MRPFNSDERVVVRATRSELLTPALVGSEVGPLGGNRKMGGTHSSPDVSFFMLLFST